MPLPNLYCQKEGCSFDLICPSGLRGKLLWVFLDYLSRNGVSDKEPNFVLASVNTAHVLEQSIRCVAQNDRNLGTRPFTTPLSQMLECDRHNRVFTTVSL